MADFLINWAIGGLTNGWFPNHGGIPKFNNNGKYLYSTYYDMVRRVFRFLSRWLQVTRNPFNTYRKVFLDSTIYNNRKVLSKIKNKQNISIRIKREDEEIRAVFFLFKFWRSSKKITITKIKSQKFRRRVVTVWRQSFGRSMIKISSRKKEKTIILYFKNHREKLEYIRVCV